MSVIPSDIAVELGRTAPDSNSPEYSQWELWIADALMLISARKGIPPLADLNQTHLDYVVRQAVAAHIRKPDDATQVAISVDDGSVSKSYKSSRGRVEILDEWWALLSPADTTTRAFSVRPSCSTANHLPWCSLAFGALYCSCGTDIAGYPIFELGDEG